MLEDVIPVLHTSSSLYSYTWYIMIQVRLQYSTGTTHDGRLPGCGRLPVLYVIYQYYVVAERKEKTSIIRVRPRLLV